MAERSSGPVRPPVIDLIAKPATRPQTPVDEPAMPDSSAAEPVTPAADAMSDAPRPPPRPLARLAMPWSAISIAAVAGAVLGTMLTYAAVNFVALPDGRPLIADPSAKLAAQDQAIAELSARLTAAEAATGAAQSASATASDLEALRQQVAAIAAPTVVDLAPLEAQVASIEDRIVAIGAGASGADATALAETIARLEGGIGEVRATLETLTQRTGTAEQSVATLRGELDASRSAVAAPPSTTNGNDIGAAVRLPLMVSGIESAFANGRAYSAELAGLSTMLPDLAVPEAIRTAADTGLPRPDAVALAFTDAVPAILAGRAATGSGDLTQDAFDWAKGLLALRPMEETEGDTPEAIVSRLEAAVARRDFVAATALLDILPEPMQAGAGASATGIRALAAADGFIAALRTTALDQPVPEQPTPAPAAPEAVAPEAPATEQPATEQAGEATP